jgi:hypothetical protein
MPHPQKPEAEATRAELCDAGVCWAPKKLKARVSEYNAMYKRITKHAVELSQSRGRIVSVEQAAEELAVNIKKVTQPKKDGGMTMYAFMEECTSWLRQQAAAAAAAAAVGDDDGDGDEAAGEAAADEV